MFDPFCSLYKLSDQFRLFNVRPTQEEKRSLLDKYFSLSQDLPVGSTLSINVFKEGNLFYCDSYLVLEDEKMTSNKLGKELLEAVEKSYQDLKQKIERKINFSKTYSTFKDISGGLYENA